MHAEVKEEELVDAVVMRVATVMVMEGEELRGQEKEVGGGDWR